MAAPSPASPPPAAPALAEQALPFALLVTLSSLGGLARRWLNRQADHDAGLTGPRVMLLLLLSTQPSFTMSELAELLDVTPRAITRLVDGLEEHGYVRRVRDEADRRIVHVGCAPHIRDSIRDSLSEFDARVAHLAADIDPAALRAALEVLEQFGHALREELN
ncbi:MarR family winged helix-turn-helix transcriptional regulator [Buchananella hordeovulneris]|uniref:MarR family winged helix-turn-helix transcriptional regulator n=1 Tax=Buchananella hordeovulneris TaxID=52770 RepID=UPI0026DAF204|nr:MarR family transcriptional regulator [Buchananella hordeovulneris]MDO5079889.1 MarR family transcriptional regulator [Buchananella hordeovulneris]